MAKKLWQVWMIGLLGAVVGATAVRAGTSSQFNWPVPRIASRARPSVAVVLNYQKGRLRGMGTGVVINARGDIVTNYHVVEHANRVGVALANGRHFTATLVGADPPTDLAVVHVAHAGPLTPVRFASSKAIVPGDLVVAIGNSLGLTYSVTAGVISATNRIVSRDGQLYHLIQTDAAINPGNSGGPLLNTRGQLIGINSSKISQAGVEGIGFAIPSNVVKAIVGQILAYGAVRRPWVGVAVDSTRSGSPGLFVAFVAADSPAARAGIRPGDFIAKVNGRPVHTVYQWQSMISQTPIGKTLDLTIWRGSAPLLIPVRVAERSQSAKSHASTA